MNKHKYRFMAPSLLILVGLLSCTAGQTNVAGPQKTILATAPGSPIAIACEPSNVVAGDLNKDGKPDLVVACGEARSLMVLLGTDKGRRLSHVYSHSTAGWSRRHRTRRCEWRQQPGSGYGQPR